MIVNIGEGADSAVTEALIALLESLKKSEGEAVQLTDKEATFGTSDLRQFFVDSGIATKKQTASFASRAMENLLSCFLISGHISKIKAICQNCGKISGECRCDKSGSEVHHYGGSSGIWAYSFFPVNWRVTYASFLQLTEEDFDRLSKQSGERLKRFQEHLKAQT